MSKVKVAKHNQPWSDLVMTPDLLATQIINHFNPTGTILDPCRGEGAFYNNYPKDCKKDWCELDEGRNFFNFEGKVDWIITNPPWSKIRQFIEYSTKIADNVVYLITINHMFTKARLRIIHNAGYKLKEFYCVPFPKHWTLQGMQLAAIHFQRGYDGGAIITGDIGK